MTAEPQQWGPLDLTIRQGQDYRRTLVWQANGAPIDVTGYQAHAQIRHASGGPILCDLVSSGTADRAALASGSITVGTTDGTLVLLIAKGQTALLPATAALWDLFLTQPNGDVVPLLAGAVTIAARITQ